VLAGAVAADAELRFLVHLDLRDHPARRGIQADEVDARRLADDASSSVAAHEVLRSERRPARQLDVDAALVLSEPDHLVAAKDGNAELVDPLGQDAFDVALPEREHVVVPRGEVADVQRDQREARARVRLSRRDEPFGDAALIEHLDRAGVKTAGSRPVEVASGAALDHDEVDSGERQLAGQHQSRGASAHDRHRMLGHSDIPSRSSGNDTRISLLPLVGPSSRPPIIGPDRGLAASPPLANRLEVAGCVDRRAAGSRRSHPS
jgi:hypothetical protein